MNTKKNCSVYYAISCDSCNHREMCKYREEMEAFYNRVRKLTEDDASKLSNIVESIGILCKMRYS